MQTTNMDVPGLNSVPCGRCKKRRVKCDRRKPDCLRCEKLGTPCPGYDRVRGFVDQGQSLRRKLESHPSEASTPYSALAPTPQASASHPSQAGCSSSSPYLGNAIDEGNVGAARVPTEEKPTPVTPVFTATDQGRESTVDTDFESSFFDIDPDEYYAHDDNACGFLPNTPLMDEQGAASEENNSLATQIFFDDFKEAAADFITTPSRDRELYEADLMRHYVDMVSPWLDVFDNERFFGHSVPIRATHSTLLKDAVAAVAAKQFGNMQRESPHPRPINRNPSVLEMNYYDGQIDWLYEAAGFYDRAIRHMITSLEALRESRGSSSPSEASSPRTNMFFARRNTMYSDQTDSSANQETVDDLLAAVSMFLLYESLDNRHTSMLQHMIGVQHLLRVDSTTNSLRRIDTTKAWQASFWNFASFDCIVSYSAHSRVELDVSDVQLWMSAGLPMMIVSGKCIPEPLFRAERNPSTDKMSETMACRSLVWILLKTLDYVALQPGDGSSENSQRGDSPAPAASSISSSSTLGESNCWDDISQHLKGWFAALPDTFKPTFRIARSRRYAVPTTPKKQSAGESSTMPKPFWGEPNATPKPSPSEPQAVNVPLPEVFYSNSMAAAALVLYHFTCMVLLLHKPATHTSFTPQISTRRLMAYRQFSNQLNHHAQEICAIALGRPPPAVQLQMLQPLYLAGLCLESSPQRIVLENVLGDLQERTGCSTEGGLRRLRAEWFARRC